jgi:peptidoglycan/xylan/chitin deacetylase (PgdA/CDA1 family)
VTLPNIVINFHAVHDAEWMERVLCLLTRTYTIVSLGELEQFYYQGRILKNSCHLTFDDGDLTFFECVYPLLKKHGIPASIYVSPLQARNNGNFWFQEIRGYDPLILCQLTKRVIYATSLDLNSSNVYAYMKNLSLHQIWDIIEEYKKETQTQAKPRQNMNLEELMDIYSNGLVEIGAHTQNHPILANEKDSVSEYEIQSSIKELGDMFGKEIKYFAYPNGIPGLDFGSREIELLKQAGVRMAFSTHVKHFSLKDNVFSIPRNGLSRGGNTFMLMKLIFGGGWEVIKKSKVGKQEEFLRKMLKVNHEG